jgi:hypothetical protein
MSISGYLFFSHHFLRLCRLDTVGLCLAGKGNETSRPTSFYPPPPTHVDDGPDAYPEGDSGYMLFEPTPTNAVHTATESSAIKTVDAAHVTTVPPPPPDVGEASDGFYSCASPTTTHDDGRTHKGVTSLELSASASEITGVELRGSASDMLDTTEYRGVSSRSRPTSEAFPASPTTDASPAAGTEVEEDADAAAVAAVPRRPQRQTGAEKQSWRRTIVLEEKRQLEEELKRTQAQEAASREAALRSQQELEQAAKEAEALRAQQRKDMAKFEAEATAQAKATEAAAKAEQLRLTTAADEREQALKVRLAEIEAREVRCAFFDSFKRAGV